jgi:hypothetical protein
MLDFGLLNIQTKPQLSVFNLGIENPLGGGTCAKTESSL